MPTYNVICENTKSIKNGDDNKGAGRSAPLKHRIKIKNIQKNRWIYSHSKKKRRERPLNSIWWPATSSDSASVWSNGALLASKIVYKKSIEANGGRAKTSHVCVVTVESIFRPAVCQYKNIKQAEKNTSKKIDISNTRPAAMTEYLERCPIAM